MRYAIDKTSRQMLAVIASLATVALISLMAFAIQPACAYAATVDYEAAQTDVKFYVDDNRSVQVSFNWGWELFDKDASEYDHDLATAALCLSNAAEHSQNEVESMLRTLGFEIEDDSSKYYGDEYWGETNVSHPAVTFGLQVVEMDGKKTNVIVAVIRGTKEGDLGDYTTDFGALFDAFGLAAQYTANDFYDFILAHTDDLALDDGSDNKIFITGHSLGGATAGYVARNLAKYYGEESKSDTFVYTFAAPNNASSTEAAENWSNVHNIINISDAVPSVPPWYERSGVDHLYDAAADTYANAIAAVYGDVARVEAIRQASGLITINHYCATYLACMLSSTPEDINSSATASIKLNGEVIETDSKCAQATEKEYVEAGDVSPDTEIHLLDENGDPLKDVHIEVLDYAISRVSLDLDDTGTFKLSDLATFGEYDLTDKVARISVRVEGGQGRYYFKVNVSSTSNVDSLDVTVKLSTTERDIFLVLDSSGSMEGDPIDQTKQAAGEFIGSVFDYGANVGLIDFDSDAVTIEGLTDESSDLIDGLSELEAGDWTNIGEGLQAAYDGLKDSDASRRIVVLMSDGEASRGLEGDELVAKAQELKDDGILVYCLGFFHALDDDQKANCQDLMNRIASPGCYYDVSDADNLVYFFGDIGEQINGTRYMYVRIACPVDVSVTLGDETLSSAGADETQRASFGSLVFEQTGEDGDTAKIMRLREGEPYELAIEGTGTGTMDYTIGFVDDDGFYTDMRNFSDVEVCEDTQITTCAEMADSTAMQVDYDGDGQVDHFYKATANGSAEELDPNWMRPVVAYGVAAGVAVALLLVGCIWFSKQKHRLAKAHKADSASSGGDAGDDAKKMERA